MASQFHVLSNPRPEDFTELEGRFPRNVFCTAAYANAMDALGQRVSIISVRRDRRIKSGCLGLVRDGRLSRSLEITSVPMLDDPTDAFWSGLRAHCADTRVTELAVHSFGSEHAVIPSLGIETSRAPRVEFVLDLDGTDPWNRLDKKHQQSLKKARQSKLTLRVSTDAAAVAEHVRLMTLSLQRHATKGEAIADSADERPLRALVEHGAAKVYQVVSDRGVLASATVLRSTAGAYYHTAGNHPDGLAVGASHFLLYEIASELSQSLVREFNLGGTHPSNEGLVRFKTRFGARPVALEAATFALGSPMRRRLLSFTRDVRAALR